MSELKIEVTCWQTCDLCGEKIILPSEKDLLEVIQIPIDFYSDGGGRHVVTERLSACNACLVDLKNYLNQKYDICEYDYGGVVVNRKEKK